MTKFKQKRLDAKKYWMGTMNRRRYINDVLYDTYECEWQNDHVPATKHNSIFCSIGEWSSNVSDILYEERYDNLDYSRELHASTLFRYYTRFLLITSEILTDFQDIIIEIKSYTDRNSKKKARTDLTDPLLPFTIQNLFDFINNVCKHKAGSNASNFKYHLCNNHLKYAFEDEATFITSAANIKITNLKTQRFRHGMKLEVPKLIDIIKHIENCYLVLDDILKNYNQAKVRTVLSHYEINLSELD